MRRSTISLLIVVAICTGITLNADAANDYDVVEAKSTTLARISILDKYGGAFAIDEVVIGDGSPIIFEEDEFTVDFCAEVKSGVFYAHYQINEIKKGKKFAAWTIKDGASHFASRGHSSYLVEVVWCGEG